MWWYYLQGFQADLWNSLPPKIASNMYAKIFDHTYGILVGRYAKVNFFLTLFQPWMDKYSLKHIHHNLNNETLF